jgi:hypothetical protein
VAILYCLNAVIGGAAILVGIDLVQTIANEGFVMEVDDFCAPAGRRLVDWGEGMDFGEGWAAWGEGSW